MLDYIIWLLYGTYDDERIRLLNQDPDPILDIEAEMNATTEVSDDEIIPSQHTLRQRHLVLQEIKQQSTKLKPRKKELHPLALKKNRFKLKRNKKYR